MPLRNILKKKEKPAPLKETTRNLSSEEVPEFIFLRTTTNLQEEIQPPSYPGDNLPIPLTPTKEKESSRSLFHRSPKKEKETVKKEKDIPKKDNPESGHAVERLATPHSTPRRLSGRFEKLHLGRARSASATSVHVPTDLPDIPSSGLNAEAAEAEWEKRASLLAQGASRSRSTSLASVTRSAEGERGMEGSKAGAGSDVSLHSLTFGITKEYTDLSKAEHTRSDPASRSRR